MSLKLFFQCFFTTTVFGLFSSDLRGVVPTTEPVFNDPLNFTSALVPFQPGGVKVFSGESGQTNIVVVHSHLFQIREFNWKGTNVATHILREMKFEGGQLAKFIDQYWAQASDGNVYSFGKSVTSVTNNAVENHEGSWLVGGPTSADPSETVSADGPALAMLAEPEPGDRFKTEDVSSQLSTTARILSTNATLKTGIGVFSNVVRVIEHPVKRGSIIRNYAREVGAISEKRPRESWRLVSSTLLGPDLAVFTNNLISPTNSIPVPTNSIPFPTNAIGTPISPEIPTIPGTPVDPTDPADPEEPESPEEPPDSETPVGPEIPLPPMPG